MAVMAKSLFKLRKAPGHAPTQAPTQARSQATVEVILEATAQLLEEDSPAAPSRIAARAGLSIGVLRQYFPNRDAILAAMTEREQLRILKGVDAALRQLDPEQPEAAIRAALRFFLDAFQSRQKLRRQIILTVLPRMPDAMRGRVVDAVLGEVLETLEERCGGRFRPLDGIGRFVLTRAVMGVVRSAVIEGVVDLREPALEEALLTLILRQLAPETVATAVG